ncbi:MAG: hypothetical protein AAFR46_13710 [Pseudomonadota bacterium]
MRINWHETSVKSAIVLVPSYFAAYTTEKMVWVVPTLVAAGFFANGVSLPSKTKHRLDEDSEAVASDPIETKDETATLENETVGRGELPDT